MKRAFNQILGLAGLEIRRTKATAVHYPVELDKDTRGLIHWIIENELSMTWYHRLFATALSCKYVVENSIAGDFVECGVWRGGNAILAAAIFKMMGSHRRVLLFDTFEGMTEPTKSDINERTGVAAIGEYRKKQKADFNEWCFASLEEVKSNFQKLDLLSENVKFIKGDVLQTLSERNNIPAAISVLRLDTDWYESTKKELETLYPTLSIGGVLMIDDYGAWQGARKATDEYFEDKTERPLLNYVDHTGRIGVKRC